MRMLPAVQFNEGHYLHETNHSSSCTFVLVCNMSEFQFSCSYKAGGSSQTLKHCSRKSILFLHNFGLT